MRYSLSVIIVLISTLGLSQSKLQFRPSLTSSYMIYTLKERKDISLSMQFLSKYNEDLSNAWSNDLGLDVLSPLKNGLNLTTGIHVSQFMLCYDNELTVEDGGFRFKESLIGLGIPVGVEMKLPISNLIGVFGLHSELYSYFLQQLTYTQDVADYYEISNGNGSFEVVNTIPFMLGAGVDAGILLPLKKHELGVHVKYTFRNSLPRKASLVAIQQNLIGLKLSLYL